MNKQEYKEYLLSDHWKNIREEIIAYWDGKCAICNSSDNLNVHHRTYENIGHESTTDLILLCENCHFNFHWLLVQPEPITDYRQGSCFDCRYFQKLLADNGLCRRYAPSPGNYRAEFTGWPRVGNLAWCGEFEEARVEP